MGGDFGVQMRDWNISNLRTHRFVTAMDGRLERSHLVKHSDVYYAGCRPFACICGAASELSIMQLFSRINLVDLHSICFDGPISPELNTSNRSENCRLCVPSHDDSVDVLTPLFPENARLRKRVSTLSKPVIKTGELSHSDQQSSTLST